MRVLAAGPSRTARTTPSERWGPATYTSGLASARLNDRIPTARESASRSNAERSATPSVIIAAIRPDVLLAAPGYRGECSARNALM
jgi:hypothetical protein